MAEHPLSATQPTTRFTSSLRTLQRNDNDHPDVFTAPMKQSFSTSSSDKWCDTVKEARVQSATKVRTRSSSSKTKLKCKSQKYPGCCAPSRVEKKCRTSARVRSIIHGIDVVLSSTTSEDPALTPTSVLSTSNLKGQQFYHPIQMFYDSQDDEIPYLLAFGGDIAPQDGQQYPFWYGVRKPFGSEQDALISAMAEIHISGDISQIPLN